MELSHQPRPPDNFVTGMIEVTPVHQSADAAGGEMADTPIPVINTEEDMDYVAETMEEENEVSYRN